jgi:SAM-dependent methyltransferase
LRGQLARWAVSTASGDPAPDPQAGLAGAAERERALALARAGWDREGHEPLLRAIEPVGELLAELTGVRTGARVLDACAGDGNVARACVRRGAAVSACDLAPSMVVRGRKRCPQAAWATADVQALPYADASFDVVVSAFGATLAPRPLRAVRELTRVVRPGGMVALATWSPRGLPGALDAHAELVAPRPDGVPPPVRWGEATTARARLAPSLEALELRTRTVALWFPSPAALFDALVRPLPLDDAARRELRPAFDHLLASCNNDASGGVEVDARFLVAVGRRPATPTA